VSKLPNSIAKLVEELVKLPSIGEVTATRLALYLAKQPLNQINELAEAIQNVRVMTQTCKVCFNYADEELCSICSNPNRDLSIICVVPTIKELIAIEKTDSYKGLYHVLQGLIDPMNGILPERLRFKELFSRLSKNPETETILALGTSVEAVASSLYMNKFAKVNDLKVTEIAYGVSVGSEISAADPMTIMKAMEGRREL
jgi:recombination protein RecR